MMQSFPHWVLKSYKQLILFYYREKSRARKKCGRNRSDSEKALLRASMIRDFSGISHGSESLQKKSPQKERGRDLVEAPAVSKRNLSIRKVGVGDVLPEMLCRLRFIYRETMEVVFYFLCC